MADNNGNSQPQFSMPPSMGGMPGQAGQQQGFENGNGQGMPSQPPLGLNIPQNNNPLPMDISEVNMLDAMNSPMSAGGTIRRAAPEPNKRALYVGGLDPRVTEEVLRQIFETTGHVQNVKIIPDKNVSHFTSAQRLHSLASETMHVMHLTMNTTSYESLMINHVYFVERHWPHICEEPAYNYYDLSHLSSYTRQHIHLKALFLTLPVLLSVPVQGLQLRFR
jgi:hypothetical protein